jgi:hypothetical protein
MTAFEVRLLWECSCGHHQDDCRPRYQMSKSARFFCRRWWQRRGCLVRMTSTPSSSLPKSVPRSSKRCGCARRILAAQQLPHRPFCPIATAARTPQVGFPDDWKVSGAQADEIKAMLMGAAAEKKTLQASGGQLQWYHHLTDDQLKQCANDPQLFAARFCLQSARVRVLDQAL